jgi:hypothetical protein
LIFSIKAKIEKWTHSYEKLDFTVRHRSLPMRPAWLFSKKTITIYLIKGYGWAYRAAIPSFTIVAIVGKWAYYSNLLASPTILSH